MKLRSLNGRALILAAIVMLGAQELLVAAIDRQALVTRHNVVLTNADEKTPLQVGNGEFAFSADITGLQTFLPANTMSHWGWHSFPLPPGKKPSELRLENFDTYGRPVGYATSSAGQADIYNWMRENPHRLNLGRLALQIKKADGTAAVLEDLKQPQQSLDLWRGLITSRYEIEGQPVKVETCCHPELDLVAVRIESPLVASGRLVVELSFPYGSPGTSGADWSKPDAHRTTLTQPGARRADFTRKLDADEYNASLAWTTAAELTSPKTHTFLLQPSAGATSLEFVCAFAPTGHLATNRVVAAPIPKKLPTFADVKKASAQHWAAYWKSGGAIDLSGSKDPRWNELERRIVLSQYLLAVQEAGSLPPEESGLINNGWNGKFHLEMHWWHEIQFALWGRWPLFELSLGWYRQTLASAQRLAQSQGYRGARWPKMTGPDGQDSPSGIGPLLIWQEPHPIYYAEMDYRLHPTRATLQRWRDVVFNTADFLASFAVLDPASRRYVLGPPLMTVPENSIARTTRNPAFELSYWRFGLRVAQEWRTRLGLPRDADWDKVLNGLVPLPVQDGLYLEQESLTNTYTAWNWEHPSLIGPLGMLPGDGVDPVIMRATVRKVIATWDWERKSWGWDFPLVAMAAARNGEPELAVEALLNPTARNQFEANGLSDGGPFPYFPSNGGLLTAVAMMAAGWDGAPARNAPGFPTNGQWTVRWEGLKPLP